MQDGLLLSNFTKAAEALQQQQVPVRFGRINLDHAIAAGTPLVLSAFGGCAV
jgi:hypothetical protein